MDKLKLTMRFVEGQDSFEKELLSRDGNQKYEIVDDKGEVLHTNQTNKPDNISYTPAEYKGVITMMCAELGVSTSNVESLTCERDYGLEKNTDIYYPAQNSILRTVEIKDSNEKFNVVVSESSSFDKIDYNYSDKYHASEIFQTINGKQFPLLYATGHKTDGGEVINTHVEITIRDENTDGIEIGKISLRDNGSLQINEKHYCVSKEDAVRLLKGELNGIDDVERLVQDIDDTDKKELGDLLPEEKLLSAIFGAEMFMDNAE